MSLEQARNQQAALYHRHIYSNEETCSELNRATLLVLHEMTRSLAPIWVGKINLYGDERRKNGGTAPIMWQWKRGDDEPRTARFAVPRHDAELERLIIERDLAPYTGTAEDTVRVDAIMDRIEALGGVSLLWV